MTYAFEDIMGMMGMGDDGKEYRCVGCKYPLEKIVVQIMMKEYKKLFYCKRNVCARFGNVTVIAKVSNKPSVKR